jgi:hypothetical protein
MTQRRLNMKRILTTILMAVGITGTFATQLGAQQHRAVAEIPFAFEAGNRTFPAGTYGVSQTLAIAGDSSVFTLIDGRLHSAFVQLNTNETGHPDNPSLTFACYGKECVLAKVTPPGSARAYGLSQSYIEKHLHHTLGMASLISVKLAAR